MEKYIDAEKLIAKIKELNLATKTYDEQVAFSNALAMVVETITSLQQEQQEVGLEKEIEKWQEEDDRIFQEYLDAKELVKLLFAKGYTKYPLSYDGDYWFCYIQMAMKWLREVHKLCISITPQVTDDDGDGGCLWQFAITSHLEPLSISLELYEQYEEACEAAIKYCLENLI